MSVPYKISEKKSDASQKLLVSSTPQPRASDRIPMIARPFVSDRAKQMLDVVSTVLR